MKLYQNGNIYTGERWINSFVVEGNLFKEAKEDQDYEEIIDLKGKYVYPGFIDSHMHILNFGNVLKQIDLRDHTSSLKEVKETLKKALPTYKEGEWIKARGWNHDYFEDENRFPTRFDLDEVSQSHPICITRACGHISVVNSKALSLLDLPEDLYMEDGQIDVDENGNILGIFRENAIDYITSKIPNPTQEEVEEMLLIAGRELNKYGVTSCHSDDFKVFDIDYKIVLRAFENLRGKLSVRVNEQSQLNKEELKEFFSNGYTTNIGDAYFKIGPLKMLGDGSLGARTAYMLTPYEDDPTTKGIAIYTLEELKEMFELAHTHKMQIAVHSIGDATFEKLLQAYDYILTKYPRDDHRHGIIHCQITNNDQIERFAKMHLHAYIQSIFLDYDIHIVRDRVGKKADESYQFMHYLNLGCHVSNGSDCPVELPDVLKGMQCAITRETIKDHLGPYLKKEGCSVKEAIDSFTSGGAYASFEENSKGKIQEGMLADFVVLDQNLFEIDPHTFKDVKVLATYMNGKQVYKG